MSEIKKPKPTSSLAEKEIDKAVEQFEEYEKNITDLTLDRMNEAKKEDKEPQTKLSQQEIHDSRDLYIKPFRTIGSREKFNEKYREDWNFAKEYVHITAENIEIKGETIDLWTKPFPGLPAEEWKVPVNKPIWVPRYVAEQIKKANYHVFSMNEDKGITGSDEVGNKYTGRIIVDSIRQRLDAFPVSNKRSFFMGAANF